MSNTDIVHSIVQGYSSIENIHSIERQREEILASKEFQSWCRRYNIGSRVEIRDTKATELMSQYGDRYTRWLKSI
jgi:hypothetical protein